MNCVRRHLSAIKGGRLAAACHPARVLTLLMSDVPGDDPMDIASGPDGGRPDDLRRCAGHRPPLRHRPCRRAVLDGAGKRPQAKRSSPAIRAWPACETRMIATPQMALEARPRSRASAGVDASHPGRRHRGRGARCRQGAGRHRAAGGATAASPSQAPCVLLSGGETTVTVRGQGRGGRNVEFLLSLAVALERRARRSCAGRRHRRRRRPGGDRRRAARARHAGARLGAGHQAARQPRRQRRPWLLRGAGRLGRHRPDADQRQRLPGDRHRRHRPPRSRLIHHAQTRNAKIVATLGPASSDRASIAGSVRGRCRCVPAELQPRHAADHQPAASRCCARWSRKPAGRSASWSTCRDRSCASAPSATVR